MGNESISASNAREAATALPCVCEHPEGEHLWDSRAAPMLTGTFSCAHQERLPRKGDEAEVRYKICSCERYKPAQQSVEVTAAEMKAAKEAVGALRYAVPPDVFVDFEKRIRPLFIALNTPRPATKGKE